MRTIAVFFGGRSSEREISVITGMLAVNLLRGDARVLPVLLGDGACYLCEGARRVEFFRGAMSGEVRETKDMVHVFFRDGCLYRARRPKKPYARLDCALNCCHGGPGEDGTLAACLAWAGIPLASPPALASALFMNKGAAKYAVKGLGIPVLPWETVREEAWSSSREEVFARARSLGYPLIVKPCRLGSSIGIAVAEDAASLARALELAFRLDSLALLEPYLPARRDINCAACACGGRLRVSPCEEVFSSREILTFSEKYEPREGKTSAFPADLPDPVSEAIRTYTQKICEAFSISGIVRADFLLSDGNVYFNELNTVPGSLALYLFGGSLTDARMLLLQLIEGACSPPPRKEIVSSGILSSPVFGAKTCKMRADGV